MENNIRRNHHPAAWQILLLVITLKCFSTLAKTFVPLSLAELHHKTKYIGEIIDDGTDREKLDYDKAEETYSLSYENAAFMVLAFSIVYNWFFPRPPGKLLGTGAAIWQCISCLGLVVLALSPMPKEYLDPDHIPPLVTTFQFIQLFSMLIIYNHVTAYCIEKGVALAVFKLSSTILIAILQIAFLVFPIYLCSQATLLVFGAILSIILFYVYNSITNATLAQNGDEQNGERVEGSGSVSLFTSLSFLIMSVIGLNGEQLLDIMMNVRIRDEHFAGSAGSAIAKQAITLISSILALVSTVGIWKSPKSKSAGASSTFLITVWAMAQFTRVTFFSGTLNTDSYLYVIALILLDKYTGSLGEVALEQGLLRFLRTRRVRKQGTFVLRFSMLWLMTVHGFIEDFTQGLCKKLVRTARKAPEDTWEGIFWHYRFAVVCALVIISALFVIRTEASKPKRQRTEEKQE